jgi:glutaredoxin-like protein NrdH
MKNVFMYTLSTCPWCRKTKQYFTDHKIPFQYVDYDLQSVEEQQKIEQEMKSRSGPLSFPWVLIGDDLVVGWNPKKYDELLALSKTS